MHRIEENLELHLQELEWLWPDLKDKVVVLCERRSDRWTLDVRQTTEKLEQALAGQHTVTVAAMFRSFRRQAGLCFFQADKMLKELCRSLRQVDGPLNSVLRDIA